jgi:hypothetical protein
MLSLRDRILGAPGGGTLEGGLLLLYGEGVIVGDGGSCCCASEVDEVLLKKDNLGDGRAGAGVFDFGGDNCGGSCCLEDLALRDAALANDDDDLVRFLAGFTFPFPLLSPPPSSR